MNEFQLKPAFDGKRLFDYRMACGKNFEMLAPSFELDGRRVVATFASKPVERPAKELRNGAVEYAWTAPVAGNEDLKMSLVFRTFKDSPILRFKLRLSSGNGVELSKNAGKDAIAYFGIDCACMRLKEVRLGDFAKVAHSYVLAEAEIDGGSLENSVPFTGPILAASATDGHVALMAYEHGAMGPDRYLQFHPYPDGVIMIVAVKGNYLAGDIISEAHPSMSSFVKAIT